MRVHLRLDGRSRTVDDPSIDPRDSDARILDRLARSLDVPESKLRQSVIDRNADAIVVRPPATFG